MSTFYELAESSWLVFFKNFFEMLEKIVKGFETVCEALIEIVEEFENEDQFQNRRLHIPVVIGSLTKESLFPPCHVPRRTGRRMGGWEGTNNLMSALE
jgi:hypothetical protein